MKDLPNDKSNKTNNLLSKEAQGIILNLIKNSSKNVIIPYN